MALDIQKDVVLAAHTTLHVGGVADYFVEVEHVDELRQALRFAQQNAAPVFLLGGGSNVLFPDAGFRGVVIKNLITGQEISEQSDEIFVQVGAGENWDTFVQTMCEKEYWGIENLSAIPGTVGATPIQNVGAYGVEVSEVIHEVVAVHRDTLEHKIFSSDECEFAYRDSYFKSPTGKEWVVVSVTFQLSKTPAPKLHYADLQNLQSSSDTLSANDVRRAVMQIRSQKFPDWSTVGTAGSFFKNPIVLAGEYERLRALYPDIPAHQVPSGDWKLSLGWILDKICGLKGYCVGQVCLYQNQALVLVNSGDSSTNIATFVDHISKKVFEKTKIKIEPEVLLVKNKIQ